MAVETSPKPLLVEEVSNETNAATKNEETVKDTHLEVVLSFFVSESTAVAEQIDKANSDAAVDVEDQVVLLGGGDLLNGQCVVEQLERGEVLLDVVLDQLHTEIGVGAGLDSVANTWDYRIG